MKTASLRELQHHMSEVMKWVDHGDEVVITRRNRVIARLVPHRVTRKKIKKWPHFTLRSRGILKKVRGSSLSSIIQESRQERF